MDEGCTLVWCLKGHYKDISMLNTKTSKYIEEGKENECVCWFKGSYCWLISHEVVIKCEPGESFVTNGRLGKSCESKSEVRCLKREFNKI